MALLPAGKEGEGGNAFAAFDLDQGEAGAISEVAESATSIARSTIDG